VQPEPQEPPAPQPEATIQVHSTIETFAPVKVSEHIEGDFKEYLLRRTKDTSKALSLLADDELIHVSEAKRNKDGTVSTQQRFMVKKEALLGISHNKFDWLDSFKFGWWSMFAGGLTLSIFGIPIGSTLLVAGLFFSCWQFADPEMITLETTTGRHRLMLNRMGSDRELMGCSMDHFSATIQNLLTSGELDTTDYENSVEGLMLERAAQLQAAAQEAAAKAESKAESKAAEPLTPSPASPAQVMVTSGTLAVSAEPMATSSIEPFPIQPPPTDSDTDLITPAVEGEPTDSIDQIQEDTQESESSDWGGASEWPEPTPPAELAEPAPPEELPEPAPPAELAEPAPPEALPEPAPPAELAEPAPPEALPEPAPPAELAEAAPPEELPEPAPPAELPEPAPPPALAPPPAPIPPPSLAPLPAPTPPLPMPPPGLGLPPVIPLPSLDPLLMDPDAAMPAPPETMVAGSPREDPMSTDEKNDLLSMLDD
jgi:hypothetical protein